MILGKYLFYSIALAEFFELKSNIRYRSNVSVFVDIANLVAYRHHFNIQRKAQEPLTAGNI